MAGLVYRHLAHEYFDGKLTARELAEAVEKARVKGQLKLFKGEEGRKSEPHNRKEERCIKTSR